MTLAEEIAAAAAKGADTSSTVKVASGTTLQTSSKSGK